MNKTALGSLIVIAIIIVAYLLLSDDGPAVIFRLLFLPVLIGLAIVWGGGYLIGRFIL